jgi:predicted MFS family arabinose efflux permease
MRKGLSSIRNAYADAFSGLSREIWLLSLVMIINRSGAMVLPFMTLYLTTSLGYSLTEAGTVMAAYGVGSILGAYIGGQLADKFGHYYIQLYSLLLGAGFLIALLFLESLLPIIATVFCFSTVADTMRPANSVATAAYSTPENRTRSFSLMRFAVNIGFSVGPAMGGMVAALIGFRWIFLIDAITCLTAAYIVKKYLSDRKRPATPESVQTSDVAQTSSPASQLPAKSKSAYRDTQYLIFILLVALYAIAFFQLFTSVPVFWEKEWGFSEAEIGLLLALNGVIVVLFEMPFMKYMEHFQRYMVMITFGSLLMFLSFLLLLSGWGGAFAAIGFIVFMSISEMFAMPFMTNYAISVPGEDRRGQYMALYAMAYGVAHIIAPAGSLSLADKYGFSVLYLVMAILSVLIAAAFFQMRARKVSHMAMP